MKQEDNGSLYDQFPSHEAPKQERAVGWVQNREDNSKPYVNDQPSHVSEAMVVTKEDHSASGFWRLFTNQNPKDTFENSVNIIFGGRDAIGAFFKEKKVEYIKLYRQKMEEL